MFRKSFDRSSTSGQGASRGGYGTRTPASGGGYGSRSSSGQSSGGYGGARRFGGSSSAGRSHSSYGGGSRFGGARRGGGGGRNFRNMGQHIDVSRFVNKAVITEEIENFVPEHRFTDFQIDERLKANIITKGYTAPTPIQDRSIPHILRGSDLVGIANTGTGKTAAFLIPLINKVLVNTREQILIIVPTHELAMQIEKELQGFTKGLHIFSVCCVGGSPIGRQMSALKYHNQFVIGTPGRLKDLVERKRLNLQGFNTLVLDEADRMLDMGFIGDMRFMVSHMHAKRHTLFFSATLSSEIEVLIKDFLKEPIRVSVKTQDTSKNVDQDIVRIPRGENKFVVLANLLAQPDFQKVLVFSRTKHGAEKLSDELIKRGFKADSIHGDKNHVKRQKALNLFKESHVNILVATDVAARGLDISGISHVINYDIPATYDDYVHRIGRTGRGGKKGKALTFVE